MIATADILNACTRADDLDELEAEAWRVYLDTCRSQDPLWYDDVEPWAWAILQRRLVSIGARRALRGEA